MTPSLHLIRLELDTRAMLQRGSVARIPLRDIDFDYLAHMALEEVFGQRTLRPFRIRDIDGRRFEVLAYSATPADALAATARATASPDAFHLVDWDTLQGKQMPDTFQPGARFGFQVRACPVVRVRANHPVFREGAEIDAFLANTTVVNQDVPVDREAVYVDWLARQFTRDGAAGELSAQVTHFALARQVRRTHAERRTSRQSSRPDVVFEGTFAVGQPAAFTKLLAAGIGRHKAFGFGMVLLKPASR